VKIGYLTFGRDDFGYGLALCLDRIKGHEIYRVTPKTAKLVDILLFSCFWWEHIYLLADFLRKAGIKKGSSPRVIVGGFNTFNPVQFQPYADFAVCGDGEEILPSVLQGQDPGLTWHNAPAIIPFAHKTGEITRIEIARGCKYRCKFCAVSHLKPYRELPVEEIDKLLRGVKTKRVSLFAPERTLHSANDEIGHLCERYGLSNVDSDVRLDRISKSHQVSGIPRIGIEGISERLRKSVNKPYSDEQIIEAARQAITEGRKGLFLYFILDLPGESAEDWEEFRALLRKVGEIPESDRFLFVPSPNLFMPTPWTPMEYDGLHWERPYLQIWSEFFGRGGNRNWKAMIVERTRVFAPEARVLCMISTRAGEEFFEIEAELTREKAIRLSGGRVKCLSRTKLLRVLKKHGGPEKYCDPRFPEGDNPWKKLVIKGVTPEIKRP
jgi:radical SAM superfamily enzyme YgiQ (UPF0313 family)